LESAFDLSCFSLQPNLDLIAEKVPGYDYPGQEEDEQSQVLSVQEQYFLIAGTERNQNQSAADTSFRRATLPI
jgi:hypothetical protein